ncbi:hypothetical protein C2845_PM03G18750 [Panicum miliaceum]|uniref:DUF1409 domain-containing protein n=1 Tax=Panicum miliaceum TaxID=4540 RepID=A0A3L6T892_PANMI|nr:hypothetical protein C2845_PM03G18750 [Panicum miliaceum]
MSTPTISSTLSEDTKDKLHDILHLLNQDIGVLIQDAEGIRRMLNLLKDQLLDDVESAIIPGAFIEGRRCAVLNAQQLLADHSLQTQLLQQNEVNRSKANDIRTRVELLENFRPTIVIKIDRLRAQRDKLLKELDSVNTALTAEESKLQNLPVAIEEMKANMKTSVREAVRLQKQIKPIPGSADEDQQKIDEVNQIRLDAIVAIEKLLGSA